VWSKSLNSNFSTKLLATFELPTKIASFYVMALYCLLSLLYMVCQLNDSLLVDYW